MHLNALHSLVQACVAQKMTSLGMLADRACTHRKQYLPLKYNTNTIECARSNP